MKQDVECQGRDRLAADSPQNRGVRLLNSKYEIEITDAMLREATRVLHWSGLLEYLAYDSDALVVKEMLRMAIPLARPILSKMYEDH